MNLDVALLPEMLPQADLAASTVVVFDVLRATTTMAFALAAGVREIHVFGTTELARIAARDDVNILLCGESQCLPPAGFHLGNSPLAFTESSYLGRIVYMSTTNGTRAILAAQGARRMFTGAVVNASHVAREISGDSSIILLCSGTNGQIAAEDVIGAGAVIRSLRALADVNLRTDVSRMAEDLFVAHRADLTSALRNTRGGQNVIAAGLDLDIECAAKLNSVAAVGEVSGKSPIVRWNRPKLSR